jgi:hypothetical protein
MNIHHFNIRFSFKVVFVLLVMAIVSGFTCKEQAARQAVTNTASKKIKIALLLDTSNSMDGLIEQAKSQLWTIVNELAKAKCDNVKPEIKIALYEYGNDNLPSSEGFIRLVTPLTDDLDQISKDLFALRTCGGQEYCGQVIASALKELDWSTSSGDYQVVFIAGNEPFNQGTVNYRQSCENAKHKGVTVNTIFCGNFDEGVNTEWKNGALLTGGDYMSIEQNRKTVYIETPYDKDIYSLNEKLNATYIAYGSQGLKKKAMQMEQDQNASSYGQANAVKRVVSKSSHAYKNTSWDVVDAAKDKNFKLAEIREEELPAEMKGLTPVQKQDFVNKKTKERDEITQKIAALNLKREQYIAQQQKNSGEESALDNAMLNSIKKQAVAKSFEF